MKTTLNLKRIEKEISQSKRRLALLHTERKAARSLPPRRATAHSLLLRAALPPKSYSLVAQGDSWFDYPTSWDLIDWLGEHHGHDIDNLGVAGSTLNDIVYGPVPKNWLGIPQSDETSRSAELIQRIEEKRPQAVLLSGGGNDIAGDEFFSFVNNALSGLANPNQTVLDGVVAQTFWKAYSDLIDLINAKAKQMKTVLPIFVHGYDYPFPDGRGFSVFNLVGPWFHETFNRKNYPYDDDNKDAETELAIRRKIVGTFIDSLNTMLAKLAANYPAGNVIYVDLRGTLKTRREWANELHPKKEGFGKLADKINLALHTVLK
jgi:lysophospholipase L1-like esterase